MNELIINEEINVENLIYEVRGKQVMLDSDLAKLYQCTNGTKSINLAVKRHINRFPERFMFQLTTDEYIKLRFQFETTNYNNMSRTLPYVFTEQGVAMLATVLHTSNAEKISIAIMDAFVKLRRYVSDSLVEQKYINNMVLKHDGDIKVLQDTFNRFNSRVNEIYFNGQIYDAYSKLIDIMSAAEKMIIIIDSYADKSVLDMISKINKKVVLITRNNNLLKEIDIKKYNEQYHNLEIKYNNSFHDRYIILDKKEVYHCGTSLNHAGSKTFSINKIEDEFIINALINKILK